jgi:hypothetical protein
MLKKGFFSDDDMSKKKKKQTFELYSRFIVARLALRILEVQVARRQVRLMKM